MNSSFNNIATRAEYGDLSAMEEFALQLRQQGQERDAFYWLYLALSSTADSVRLTSGASYEFILSKMLDFFTSIKQKRVFTEDHADARIFIKAAEAYATMDPARGYAHLGAFYSLKPGWAQKAAHFYKLSAEAGDPDALFIILSEKYGKASSLQEYEDVLAGFVRLRGMKGGDSAYSEEIFTCLTIVAGKRCQNHDYEAALDLYQKAQKESAAGGAARRSAVADSICECAEYIVARNHIVAAKALCTKGHYPQSRETLQEATAYLEGFAQAGNKRPRTQELLDDIEKLQDLCFVKQFEQDYVHPAEEAFAQGDYPAAKKACKTALDAAAKQKNIHGRLLPLAEQKKRLCSIFDSSCVEIFKQDYVRPAEEAFARKDYLAAMTACKTALDVSATQKNVHSRCLPLTEQKKRLCSIFDSSCVEIFKQDYVRPAEEAYAQGDYPVAKTACKTALDAEAKQKGVNGKRLPLAEQKKRLCSIFDSSCVEIFKQDYMRPVEEAYAQGDYPVAKTACKTALDAEAEQKGVNGKRLSLAEQKKRLCSIFDSCCVEVFKQECIAPAEVSKVSNQYEEALSLYRKAKSGLAGLRGEVCEQSVVVELAQELDVSIAKTHVEWCENTFVQTARSHLSVSSKKYVAADKAFKEAVDYLDSASGKDECNGIISNAALELRKEREEVYLKYIAAKYMVPAKKALGKQDANTIGLYFDAGDDLMKRLHGIPVKAKNHVLRNPLKERLDECMDGICSCLSGTEKTVAQCIKAGKVQPRQLDTMTSASNVIGSVLEMLTRFQSESAKAKSMCERLCGLQKSLEPLIANRYAGKITQNGYTCAAIFGGFVGVQDLYAGLPKRFVLKLVLTLGSLFLLTPAVWLISCLEIKKAKEVIALTDALRAEYDEANWEWLEWTILLLWGGLMCIFV